MLAACCHGFQQLAVQDRLSTSSSLCDKASLALTDHAVKFITDPCLITRSPLSPLLTSVVLVLDRQHKSPQSALKQAHEGDTILIFPGVYSGEGFHELTESVTIKGQFPRDPVRSPTGLRMKSRECSKLNLPTRFYDVSNCFFSVICRSLTEIF